MDENPLKALRLQAGWTQIDLADMAGITRHAVLRTEQGVYALPPPSILSVFTSRLPHLNTLALEESYRIWQTKARRRAGLLFPDAPLVSPDATGRQFLNWRTFSLGITSRMELCRLLCVHPAVVEKYEKGQQHSMPDQLFQALRESGLLLL